MDFPLHAKIPDDVIVEGAIVIVKALGPDGESQWYFRTSGSTGSVFERYGVLAAFADDVASSIAESLVETEEPPEPGS